MFYLVSKTKGIYTPTPLPLVEFIKQKRYNKMATTLQEYGVSEEQAEKMGFVITQEGLLCTPCCQAGLKFDKFTGQYSCMKCGAVW